MNELLARRFKCHYYLIHDTKAVQTTINSAITAAHSRRRRPLTIHNTFIHTELWMNVREVQVIAQEIQLNVLPHNYIQFEHAEK